MAVLRVAVEATGTHGQRLKLRDELGRYSFTGGAGSQAGLADRNRQLAQKAQKAAGNYLKANIQRRSVSTGRLLKATMAPQNIGWDRTGFAIGNPDYLDGSAAKYWRTIDQGTDFWKHPFVGSKFWVFRSKAFGATVAGIGAQGGAIAGPRFTAAGRATGGILNAITAESAARAMKTIAKRRAEAGEPSQGGSPIGQITIKHDIEAKSYYINGFRESGVIALGVQAYWTEFAKFYPDF